MNSDSDEEASDLYTRIYGPREVPALTDDEQSLYASIYGQQGTASTHTENQE